MKFRRYQCKCGEWFFPMNIIEFIFRYGKEEVKGRNWDYRTTYCPECRAKRRSEQEKGKKFPDRFQQQKFGGATMTNKGFTTIEGIIAGIFLMIVIMLVVGLFLFNTCLIKGCDTVSKQGLKPTLNQIWEGDPNYGGKEQP